MSVLVQNIAEFIAKYEGFRATKYKCTGGEWTVGYGTLVKDLPKNEKYPMSEARAMELLCERVERDWYSVDALVNVKLTENQAIALTSLVYNIGLGAFKRSTVLKRLNNGDYDGAAKAILMWNKSGGKVTKGLVNRRRDESVLFSEISPVIGSDIVKRSRTIKAARAVEYTGHTITAGTVAKAAMVATPFAGFFETLANNVPYIVAGLLVAGIAYFIISQRKKTAYEQRR